MVVSDLGRRATFRINVLRGDREMEEIEPCLLFHHHQLKVPESKVVASGIGGGPNRLYVMTNRQD